MDQDVRDPVEEFDHEELVERETLLMKVLMSKRNSMVSQHSLPNRVESLDDESEVSVYEHMPRKGCASEPRPRSRRRCISGDHMPWRLHNHDDDDATEVAGSSMFPTGLRFRKGADKKESRFHRATVPADVPARRKDLSPQRPRSRWLIPAESSFKVLWDIITVILSIANAYAKHQSIRDRKFDPAPFMVFCDMWFFVDILLNFVTERRTAEGEILRDHRSICARYLTSWFAVDALSLFPWEALYVKPLIDIQNRRGFFQRSFFRSKAVVRVSRHLRGKHFRWFGTITRHTKQHGIGAKRLLRLVIKYVPKYVLFFRNMKGVVAVRVLRQVHWVRRFYRNMLVEEKGDGMTGSLTRDDFLDEDDLSSTMSGENSRKVFVVGHEEWEQLGWEELDDDDGVPL
jgi:hypothetical protein